MREFMTRFFPCLSPKTEEPPVTAPTQFERCLAIVLHHEGGFVNHPRDPGGMTNLGVTRRVWEEWTGRPSSEEEMRSLTPEMVTPLYHARYWRVINADRLPPGVDLVTFDFGVNAGPHRGARFLQRIVGTSQDGLIGPMTISTVEQFAASHGTRELVRIYSEDRREYYRSLSTFDAFGRGWLRRTDEVEAAAQQMAER